MFRTLVALTVAVGLMGQTPAPPTALAFTDHAIESLREVSGALNVAVKSFNTHLDDAIARQDRSYRAAPAADVDLNSGPADLMWAATRKFAAFRMLARPHRDIHARRSRRFGPRRAAGLGNAEASRREYHDAAPAAGDLGSGTGSAPGCGAEGQARVALSSACGGRGIGQAGAVGASY